MRRFRGSIAYASGDYPGSQLLGGFKEGCQAHHMCCHCLGIDDDIRSKVIIYQDKLILTKILSWPALRQRVPSESFAMQIIMLKLV